jgi:hypothetical protein
VTDRFLSRFDPGYGMREEFAAMTRQSGRLLNARSHAQIIGAENLLTKAIRALASGDMEQAEQLVQRAAQIPYDAREEGSPGVRAASMVVYRRISDQFEANQDDDTTWIDVALRVHSGLDPLGQAEVASVVHGFVLQEALFTVSPAEKQRIQQAFGGAPLEAELGDAPDATVEQRQAIIRSLVMAAAALEDAYAAIPRAR